jgi:hypothetical protein
MGNNMPISQSCTFLDVGCKGCRGAGREGGRQIGNEAGKEAERQASRQGADNQRRKAGTQADRQGTRSSVLGGALLRAQPGKSVTRVFLVGESGPVACLYASLQLFQPSSYQSVRYQALFARSHFSSPTGWRQRSWFGPSFSWSAEVADWRACERPRTIPQPSLDL